MTQSANVDDLRPVSGSEANAVHQRAVFARVTRRIVPLLFACYIVAYLDRVNVGFAKLQMASALNLSDAVYGFGAGIFFLGYFLFEVPSNLVLERVGARRWIARIMVTWSVVSAAFAWVEKIPWGPLPALFGLPQAEFSFYALRFLLGVAEAGFFPGIILYLTYWFPSTRRARTVALFMTAIAAANVIGAPVSGAIMQYMDGWHGWSGWRWLFVVEAVPSALAGLMVWRWLPEGPHNAKWLSERERETVRAAILADRTMREATHSATHTTELDTQRPLHGVRAAFGDLRVWTLAYVYLTVALVLYGINFWMPTIIQELGVDRTDFLRVGFITMIPWGLGGVAMVIVGAHSDRTGERRWHVASGLLVSAIGMVLLAGTAHSAWWSIVALCLVTCGIMATLASFWAIPTGFLQHTAAAAGIAWINSVGNLGGHFGPDLIGRIRVSTESSAIAFVVLAGLATSGAFVTLWIARPRQDGAGRTIAAVHSGA